jgi:hypothetical protein
MARPRSAIAIGNYALAQSVFLIKQAPVHQLPEFLPPDTPAGLMSSLSRQQARRRFV